MNEELQMAKIVLSDKMMAQMAAKEFKNIIADMQSECLLKEGCTITDMIDQSEKQR